MRGQPLLAPSWGRKEQSMNPNHVETLSASNMSTAELEKELTGINNRIQMFLDNGIDAEELTDLYDEASDIHDAIESAYNE